MEWLKQLKDQFLDLWKRFDTQTRILLGTVIFAVLIGLIFLATWAGRPNYVPLYSNLSEQEASSIAEWLKKSNIPYQLGAGGTTIMVPQEKKYQARIDLAGDGIAPRGGSIGFEIFDQPKLGTTDKERRIQYARALSGEMQRSIEMIDGIEFARVNVSLPEQSLFVEEEKPATASVLLKLSPGFRLTQQNVAAITHLVAGGIEGMAAENVTVIDTNGNILNQAMKQGEFDFGQVATSQFQAQNQYEQKMRSALTQMLGRVFGPNNVVVTVSTQMNFDKKQVVEKTFQPVVGDEGVIRSRQTQNEEFEGTGSTASGVPGTESNIPEYQAFQEGNNNSSNYKKEQNTTNYELNQREIQQIHAPGTVEKISVSVVVNRELDDNNIANLQTMVAAAIGYNPERGDQLTILGMPFDNSLEREVEDAMKARQDAETRQLMIYGAAGLVGLIFLWAIFRRTRKKSFNRATQRVNVVIGNPEEEIAATVHQELSPEEKARREMRKELADLITNKPEDVAELLKTWLMED